MNLSSVSVCLFAARSLFVEAEEQHVLPPLLRLLTSEKETLCPLMTVLQTPSGIVSLEPVTT